MAANYVMPLQEPETIPLKRESSQWSLSDFKLLVAKLGQKRPIKEAL